MLQNKIRLNSDRPLWVHYCPLCKVQSRSFYFPSPRARHYLALTVLSVTMAVFLFPYFDAKGVIFSLPIWMGFEFYYRSRARLHLICRQCGFDPYLYKMDVSLARQKVEAFWRKKQPDTYQSRATLEAALKNVTTPGPHKPANKIANPIANPQP